MTKDEFIAQYSKINYIDEWNLGGMTGGSSWGDNAIEPVDLEIEPGYDHLYSMLIQIDELFLLKEFLMITKDPKLFIYNHWTESEFYGNYYERASREIDLEVLWKYVEII